MRFAWVGFHAEGLPALGALLASGAPLQSVLTLEPELAAKRSGSVDYRLLCERFRVPLYHIANINEPKALQILCGLGADVVFVIGWHQIVRPTALHTARVGMIGAHAALLPRAAPTARDFAWGAASGLAGGVGVALLYRGLAIGVMSVVAPVTAVCSVVIPLVVGLAQGERPAGQAIAGVLLAIAAIVLVSQSDHAEPGKRATTGLAIAIASGICIGVFLVLLQRTGPSAGLWPLAAARVVSVCCFIVVAMWCGRSCG